MSIDRLYVFFGKIKYNHIYFFINLSFNNVLVVRISYSIYGSLGFALITLYFFITLFYHEKSIKRARTTKNCPCPFYSVTNAFFSNS